jgi:tRNA pseudouridine synthase 10
VTASRAAQDYRLCPLCAERQGGEAHESTIVRGAGCYICQGLMDRVGGTAEEVARRARRYEFETFSVGVSMPEGVQEREDELRANLKLKGRETIRTQAARLIAEGVSSRVGKRVDRLKPDLTVVADIAGGGVAVSSRPLFFYGRYTKPPGISQKRGLCQDCSGRGCEKCLMTGFERGPSVEEQLRKRLARACGSDRMKFTWIGSEDKDSRVYPPGRPFVVELKNPVTRGVPKAFRTRAKGGTVSVSRGRVLPSKPTSLPSFTFRTLIKATAAKEVGAEDLAEVGRRLKRATVRFERPHERPTSKMVYLARAKKRGRRLTIEAVLDGGLPVKRFVSGELVSPSVSEVLKTEVRCSTFDIREVKETREFGFGKVTRV